jgi:DNA-binding IclR family transcriptional regulator
VDDPLRSVSISLAVLECFLGAEELGATAVAREVGIAKSTASRMLSMLASRGLLERDTRGRYRLGLRMFEYGQLVVDRLNVHELAVPVLAALRDRIGQTVQLGVPVGAEVVYLDRFERGGLVSQRFHASAWRRVPAHSSSSGRAIAAFNPLVARVIFAAGLERRTHYTVVDPRRLGEILVEVRRRGWAATEEEFELGLSSVAAPIFVERDGERQAVAAVSVAGPSPRVVGGREGATAGEVQLAARRISEALAGS